MFGLNVIYQYLVNKILENIVRELELHRINVDVECMYCDPTGMLREKYIAKNDMLDECIYTVKRYIKENVTTREN